MYTMLVCLLFFFFFSSRRRHTRFDCDWSSDVCSSDLTGRPGGGGCASARRARRCWRARSSVSWAITTWRTRSPPRSPCIRSEEHTSELQSQSISYAVFCLKKKKTHGSHRLRPADTHVPSCLMCLSIAHTSCT